MNKVYTAVFGTLLVIAGSVKAEAVLHSQDGLCRVTEQVVKGVAVSQRIFQADCARLEKAGLIAKNGENYQLTELAMSKKGTRWDLFEATLPPQKPAVKPAFMVQTTILGYKKKVGLNANSNVEISDDVAFMYLGSCSTRQDIAAMRNSVLASGNTSGVDEIEDAALRRPAHAPVKGENVTLHSGEWKYNLQIKAGEPDASGALPVTVSGQSYGPTNYNVAQTKLCNGYQPTFSKVDVQPATVLVSKTGTEVDLPLLGKVKFQLITE